MVLGPKEHSVQSVSRFATRVLRVDTQFQNVNYYLLRNATVNNKICKLTFFSPGASYKSWKGKECLRAFLFSFADSLQLKSSVFNTGISELNYGLLQGRKATFYLTTHSTHFMYYYMA